MYYISKRMEISAAHQLKLPYASKCQNAHGHNWIITVHCASEELTEYGIVVDFTKIKEVVQKPLDHHYLNEIFSSSNPTAENIAKWVCDRVNEVCEVGQCYKVDVQESSGNVCTYEV